MEGVPAHTLLFFILVDGKNRDDTPDGALLLFIGGGDQLCW